MKMQTTAGQLRAGLRLFRGIIQRRNTIPVLGTVLLRDGRLTGTDLDMQLSVALPTVGAMEGQACVDWFGLEALARCVDAGEDLTITESDNLAGVAFNGSDYRMASSPVKDFPEFETVDGPRTAAGNLGLVAALRRVQFAVSSEETRYYLNGVALLQDPDGGALAVATDGHRLAMLPIGTMPEGGRGAILPKAMVQWLCAQKHEPESVFFSGVEGDKAQPRARFDFAGMSLSAKLIDGNFPDVFRVIPREPQAMFSIDRLRLLRVLARMRAFARGSFGALKLVGDGDGLTLSLVDVGNGCSATEELPIDGRAGGSFSCGFNINYLISALSALRSETVTFSPERADMTSSPCLITGEGDDLRIVQMPMRV